MDVTTLALAVDSTQVNSAATALDKFAVSGTKAEGVSAKLTKTTAAQGRAFEPVSKGADKAALSFKTLEEAQAALGGKGANRLAAAAAELGLTQTKADAATASMVRLGEAAQTAGAKTQAALSGTAAGTVRPGTPTQAATAAAPVVGAATAGAARAIVKGNEDIAKSAKLAAFQQQQLGYQIHDFAVQVFSGQSPLTAFVQQGSQLSGAFGGAGNAFRAVTALLTPMRLAMAGVAGAVGALGLAFYEGAKQSREFADAIVLSGNYAGQTEGKFNAAAQAMAASGQLSIATIREFGQALIATGQVGPQVFVQAQEAATRFGEATGQTAQEVAKDFASMSQGVAKWAIEHNRSLNFVSAAQIKLLKDLEENNRAADAQGIVYDALNARLRQLEPNLGLIDRALRSGKNAWKEFWDAALDIGRTKTVEDKLADVDRQIKFLQTNGGSPARLNELGTERNGLLREQGTQLGAAMAKAADAEIQKQGQAANTFVDGYLKRAKSVEVLNKTLDEAKAKFKAAALANTPVSEKDQALVLAQIRKDFAGPKGTKNNEAEQVRAATLSANLSAVKDAMQDERDAFAFNSRLLQSQYQAGNQSLAEFFAERKRLIAAGTDAEIAGLEKQKQLILADKEKVEKKDPSKGIELQKQADEITRDQGRLRTQEANEVQLANNQAAESFKQLNEQVLNYRANLLQLQGDEIGAAKVRAQIAEQQLSVLAKQSQGSANPITAGDEAAAKRATDQQIALSEARLKSSGVNELLQQAEERISLAQRTGAIGEIQALQQLGSVRAQAVAELEKIVAAQEEVAKSRPEDYQLQIDTSRARLELEKLKADLDPLKEKFDNLFKDAGANFFQDLMSGKPKDALKNFGATISRELSSIASKQLSEQVFGKDGILGGLGGQFADMVGGKDRNKPQIDTSGVTGSFNRLQTAGIDPTISAFARLVASIDNAAASRLGADIHIPEPSGDTTTLPTGDFARLDRGQKTGEQTVMEMFRDAGKANQDYAATSAQSAAQVLQLANAASRGGSALAGLPSIIARLLSMIGSGSGSSGGDLFGSVAKLLGGSSGGSTYESLNSGIYGSMVGFNHSGGIVGQSADRRPVDPSIFDDAPRYHFGGIVGKLAKAVKLKANEVPAVLMGGPKGTREEVLHASDPRHRDNLSPSLAKLFGDIPRYHTGGIVGRNPDDRIPALLKAPQRQYLTPEKDSKAKTEATAKAGGTVNFNFTIPHGMNPSQAVNAGRIMGREAQVTLARRSKNT